MMRLATYLATLVLAAPAGAADHLELQTTLAPTFGRVERDGHAVLGGGAELRVSYGLSDLLSVEVAGGCDRFASLRSVGVAEEDGQQQDLVYDATRCAIIPGVEARYGSRFVGALLLGAGYRLESRSTQELVIPAAPKDIAAGPVEDERVHELVGVVRAAFDARPWDSFSVGADVALARSLAGGTSQFDLRFGLRLSLLFYP